MGRRAKSPFNHLAVLNLFREPDGTHEITVTAVGDGDDVIAEAPKDQKPIDHIENLILSAAARMKERKLADGTYRDIRS